MFNRSTRRTAAPLPSPSNPRLIDRRRLLGLGGIAAASAVAGVAGAPSAGAAAGDAMIVGSPNDGGAVTTALTSAASGGALGVSSTSAGPAVRATGRPVPAGGRVAAAGHGPALTVDGVASFSRSGRFAFPIGQSTATVDVPGGVTQKSVVFASLQNPVDILNAIERTSRDVNTGTITIALSDVAVGFPYTPVVAWLVIDVP
jgi:hypothetical protein